MKRVLVCALLIAWSGVASAVVYKWVDAKGAVHYGDHPPDGISAEIVEGLGTHSSKQAPPPATAPRASVDDKTTPDPKVKQAVDADVAAAKEKNCTDAKDRYQKLIDGRKIYTTADDGQRQYLSSDQIDAARLAAKSDIDSYCSTT